MLKLTPKKRVTTTHNRARPVTQQPTDIMSTIATAVFDADDDENDIDFVPSNEDKGDYVFYYSSSLQS